MKTFKLNADAGSIFDSVAKEAQDIAKERGLVVEFEFNGVQCLVNSKTNLTNLYRDYSNSWTMEWKTVGPDCPNKYSPEVQTDFEKRSAIIEEKRAKEQAEYRVKEEREKAQFEAKVQGVELELKDVDGWNLSRKNNSDPYGKCAMDYAEGWAKLMQVEIANGNRLADIAKKTSYELGFLGITGFMYGCAVGVLSQCWIHGEELRKWHNKEYGHEGDGVVNPAILTIG